MGILTNNLENVKLDSKIGLSTIPSFPENFLPIKATLDGSTKNRLTELGSAQIGKSVAISGDYAVIGAPTMSGGGFAAIYHRNQDTWEFAYELKAPESTIAFGSSVAIYDNWVLVGDPSQVYQGTADSGAVYTFEISSKAYKVRQTIYPTNRSASERFGFAVSLANGIAAISRPNSGFDKREVSGSNTLNNAGLVSLFRLDKTSRTWTKLGSISASGNVRNANDAFAKSVSVSGNRLAVGIPGYDYDSEESSYMVNAGAVAIFNFVTDSWVFDRLLFPTTRVANDSFGNRVALDGDVLAIGKGSDIRSVVIAEYDSVNDVWNNVSEVPPKVIGFPAGWAEPVAPLSSSGFGDSLSVSGNYLVIGAPSQSMPFVTSDANAAPSLTYTSTTITNVGSAYVYKKSSNGWELIKQIVNPKIPVWGQNEQINFGYSVSIKDNLLVIGAPMDSYDPDHRNPVTNAGSSFLFSIADNSVSFITSMSGWGQDRNVNDAFGYSFAIDNDLMIIGSPNHAYDENSKNFVSNAGAAYVFRKIEDYWVFEKKLTAFGSGSRTTNEAFGTSVEIKDNFAFVGAPGNKQSGNQIVDGVGAVYIFSRNDNQWSNVSTLYAPDAQTLDNFGYRLSYDSNVLAVSSKSSTDSSGNNPKDSAGAVYLFRNTSGFVFETKIVPNGLNARNDGDLFGSSLKINGNLLVVGSPNHSYDFDGKNPLYAAGAAWIFEYSNNSWNQVDKFSGWGQEVNPQDLFGFSAAGDSDNLFVGIVGHGYDEDAKNFVSQAGMVRWYTRSNNEWVLASKLTAGSYRSPNAYFGHSLSYDGTTLVVGAPGEGAGSQYSSTSYGPGAAYVFQKANGLWTLSQRLEAQGVNAKESSSTTSFARFGWSVAVSGSKIVIGSPMSSYNSQGDIPLTGAGAAFVFENDNSSWSQTYRMSADLISSQRQANDNFGITVAIRDSLIVIGSTNHKYDTDDSKNIGGGAAFIFQKVDTEWLPIQKITPWGQDINPLDTFGTTLEYFNGLLIVGAPGHSYDAKGLNYVSSAGAVYVFEKSNNQWIQKQKISSAIRNPNDKFGSIFAIDDFGLAITRGETVQIWEPDTNGIYSLTNTIIAPNGETNTGFGQDVKIRDAFVYVGAPKYKFDTDYQNSLDNSGAVFVYALANFELVSTLVSNARSANQYFGSHLDVRDNLLVVSSEQASLNDMNVESGSIGNVWVFAKSGNVWSFVHKITNGGIDVTSTDDFGYSADATTDLLVIGAPNHSYDVKGEKFIQSSGAAYVYRKINGNLIFEKKLVSYVRTAGEKFGTQVAVDGTRVVVSSPSYGNNSGKVWAFEQDASKTTYSKKFSIFQSTSGNQSFTIPQNVSKIRVRAVGASGGSTQTSVGGLGVYVATTLSVVPGEVLTIQVGSKGTDGVSGAGGGGRSAVLRNSDYLLVAGAGGGAGWHSAGGNAGSIGNSAYSWATNSPAGQGGSKTSGGRGGIIPSYISGTKYQGQNGSALMGGNAAVIPATNVATGGWPNGGTGYSHDNQSIGASGGGDGYFGGGASSYTASSNYGSGAGGGSSFVTGEDSVILSTFSDTTISPYEDTYSITRFGSGYMDYQNIISGNYGYRTNGIVIIEWLEENVSYDWVVLGTIIPNGLNAHNDNDQFGFSIGLTADYLVVGAPGHSYNAQGGSFVENSGAVFVYEPSTLTQIEKIVADGDNSRLVNGMFGYSVSIENNVFIVGAPGESFDSQERNQKDSAGAVWAYEINGSTVTKIAKIVGQGNTRNPQDNSGASMALLGDTLVVGAPGQDFDYENKDFVDGAGAVYVWKNNGTSWNMIQKLSAPAASRISNAGFGSSVAINSSAIVVGAPNADINNVQDIGQVYVFTKGTNSWDFLKTIDPQTGDDSPLGLFGYSLVLTENHLVIGAPGNHGAYGGRVYCFDTTTWTQNFAYGQMANLDDRFGESLSIIDNLLVVGSPLDSLDQNDINPKTAAGSATIFSYSGGWSKLQKIVAFGHDYNSGDSVGSSIAFDSSTGFMAVGAPGHSYDADGNNFLASSGAVYIWKLVGGNWIITQKLIPDNSSRVAGLNFGEVVEINGDVLTVGSPSLGGTGSIFVFEYTTSWNQTQIITAPDGVSGDRFGANISIDAASKTIVVSSENHPLDKDGLNSLTNAGAAWIFKKTTSWNFVQKITPTGTNSRFSGDNFGKSVSINGNILFIGAPNHSWDHNGNVQMVSAGAVWAFARTDSNSDFVQIQKIISRGQKKNSGDAFSTAVDQTADWLAISSPYYDYDTNQDNFKTNSGIVYLWKKVNNTFTFFTTLVSPYRVSDGNFGYSLALGNNLLIVGSPGASYDESGLNPINGAGAAHVFRFDGTSWNHSQTLIQSSLKGRSYSRFGYSVALNGSFVFVGAPYDSWDESDSITKVNAGRVYIFKDTSGTYAPYQSITPNSQEEWKENGLFGQNLSSAGEILVTSSPSHPFYQENSGAAWVFRLVNNVWIYEDTIGATFYQKNPGDEIGKSFSVYDTWMAVGSPGHDYDENEYYQKSNAGAVFIFRKINGVWTKTQKLAGHGYNNRFENDRFGEVVAINNGLMAIAAPGQSYDSLGGNNVSSAGAVFTYRLEGSIWKPITSGKLVAVGTNARNANDKFGTSMVMSDNNLVVGSPNHGYDNDGGNFLQGAGAAWLFRFDGLTWNFFNKLTGYGPNGRNANDAFSTSISIYGGLLAIGAPFHPYDIQGQNPVDGSGAVFTFFDQGKPAVIITGDRAVDPVFDVTVNNQKSIERVDVLDGGQGFLGSPEISFYPESATAYALMVSTGLSTVKLIDPGYGFTEEPVIHVVNDMYDTTGAGARVKAIFEGTSISSISVLDGGLYTRVPTLKATYGVTAHVNSLEPTSIASISVDDKGSGYSTVPTITIAGNAKAVAHMELDTVQVNTTGIRGDVNQYFRIMGGVGTPAIIKVSSVDSQGHVTGFEIYQGGDYTTTPGSSAVPIVDTSPIFRDYGEVSELATVERDYGDITGFADSTDDYGWINASSGVTVNLKYRILSIDVTTPGSNYTVMPAITANGASNVPAVMTANFSPSPIVSITVDDGGTGLTALPEIDLTEFAVEEAVTKSYFSSSSIKDLVVVSSGSGYTRTPSIIIEGGEAAAIAVAILNETSIDKIIVTDGGNNYEGWSQYSKIIEPSSENIPNGEFGKTVIGDSSNLMIASNNGFDQYGNNHQNAGSIYVYSRTNTNNDSKYIFLSDTQYMNISSIRRSLNGSYSLSFWINSSSITSSEETLLSIDNLITPTTFENILRIYVTEDSLAFKSKNNSKRMIRVSSDYTSGAMKNGSWNHIGLSFDSVSKAIAIYINGVKQNIAISETNGFITADSILTVGASVASVGNSTTYGNTFHGKVKDISAFNKILSDAEFKMLFALNYNTMSVDNSLVGLWVDNSTPDTNVSTGIKPPIWTTSNTGSIITLNGVAGTFALNSIYATDYNLISGDLPSNMYLSGNTLIWSSGWPANYSTTYTFTIRASNSIYYSDRTFTISAPSIRNAIDVLPSTFESANLSFYSGFNNSNVIAPLSNGVYAAVPGDIIFELRSGSTFSVRYDNPVNVSSVNFGYFAWITPITMKMYYKNLNGEWVASGTFDVTNSSQATMLTIGLNIPTPVLGIKFVLATTQNINFGVSEFRPK